MSSFAAALEYQTVPRHIFEQLRRSFSYFLSEGFSYLSEDDLSASQLLQEAGIEKFTLASTTQASFLLLAKPDDVCNYWVSLCAEPTTIEHFLNQPWLVDSLNRDGQAKISHLHQQVKQAVAIPSSQAAQYLVQLVHQLTLDVSGLQLDASEPPPSSATILHHVITRLDQSEPLSSLIQSTLDEVCEWLCLDRLFIYQVVKPPPLADAADAEELQPLSDALEVAPYITYEARSSLSIESVLHRSDADCLSHEFWCDRYAQRSQDAPYQAIENVALHYEQTPCLLNQLQQVNVGSQLVVPIWLNDRLWGLLIGHHCIDGTENGQRLRQWHPWEGNFLVRIAEHLALAIRQTDLEQQLQYQKLMLKAQVEERTQNLKDALMAAEAANKTKSEFLATMSHELRTPLTYIIGMSATLLRWSFGDLSPRQRDYLNTIHSSGEQLLDIINDILEVAKIEAGRTVLEVNNFSLSNLARTSLESFRKDAQAKGVDLRINLRLSEAEDSFRADPRRIRQILANLLNNAVKFTEPNGRVSLRVWRDPHNVMFQVEDTGIGIPEAQQAVLFETFRQLETARQRQYPGAGLGLALTKQLVELHNGSIQVVSTPGKGSMFTVRIPFQHPDGLANAFQSVEPVTGRIILLEDDESSASLICDLLTAANYQVIWLIEGSRIVHQVEILQPVAIILNYHLVSGNSQYIVEDLKRYVTTSGIKVISLMDSEDMETGHSPSMDSFDDCLIKPIDPPTLLSKIQSLPVGRTAG